MNRIDRISAILIQLQSRRIVKAQDIADRFGISLRTIYRDIKTLEEAGVPLAGEAGVGYSLVDGYRLPPVMFTREEAIAFMTAEKLVEKLTDTANGSNYSSAMFKIKAVLRSIDKDFLEHIDSRIEVVKAKRAPHITTDLNPLQLILQGIAQKQVLCLDYFVYYRDEHTQRHIEPVGVFYLDNYWHLIAYCRMRKDYRDFRFDRIAALTLTDDTFADKHLPLNHFIRQLYHDRDLQAVTICVDKKAVRHLGEQKYYHGYVDEVENDDSTVLSFMTLSLEGFARWYLTFADYATIIKPDTLKEKVRLIASKALENL